MMRDSPDHAQDIAELRSLRKGERTRLRIMEVTERILGSRRLKDITVAEIAAQAAVSPGTFYNYYKDVTDVVLEAVSRLPVHSPSLLALFDTPWVGLEAEHRARQLVEDYVETWDHHSTLFRVRNLAAEEGDVRFIDVRMRSAQPLLEAISTHVSRLQTEGRMPADQKPEAVAGALLAMLERVASVMRVYFDPPKQTPEGVTAPSSREEMISATTLIVTKILSIT
ncbi:MAG: TetR family transcriptional regulator [Pseudomonadota bacterium]